MSFAHRIANLFHRATVGREIEREFAVHIEMRMEDNLAAGMSLPEARRDALLRFGNPSVMRERVTTMDVASGIESFLRDLRYALRQLQKNPVFAVTVIATIALGLGATVGIFSIVHAVLLRPLPYRDADRLVVAYENLRKRNASDFALPIPDFLDLRNEARTMFEDFAGVSTNRLLLQLGDGTVEQVCSASITPNFFPLMGGKILLGRDFVDADGQAHDPPAAGKPIQNVPDAAILSYEYWQTHFAGNPAALGQRLSNGAGTSPLIVGVLTPGFELLFPPQVNIERHPDVWIAQRLRYDNADRLTPLLMTVGRMKPGASLSNAQSEVENISAQIQQIVPIDKSSDSHIELQPMHGYLVAGLKPSILALMGAAVFLLLIACANVANLLLVRISLRERELAVRTALGGKRRDLIRQVLTEALLLAVVGTIVGVGLAWLGVQALSAFAAPSQPLLASIGIDPTVLAVAVLFGLVTAVCFGIGPALYASRPNVMSVLRTAGRSSLLGAGRSLRNGVVIAEIALSFALLTGAGLMLRSFVALQKIDPGFVAHGLYTFQILGTPQEKPEQRAAFVREIEDRLRSIPGVESVTAASPFPLADQFVPIRWGTEEAVGDPSRFHAADYQVVLPGYFETLHTPLLAGRTFTEADNLTQRSLVVIDQLLAAKAFPHQSAVGKRILIRIRTPEPEWVQVIGVVAHQRDSSLAEPGREQVYFTDGFMGHGNATRWAIRTAQDPASVQGAVRDRITQFSKQLVLTEMKPMDTLVLQAQATTRLSFVLIGAFASIAALLSALGIYGVLATSVRQRTAEIGVRLALGAPRNKIFNLIVGHGLTLGTSGILIGLVVAFGLTHWISSLLVEIKASDPLTFLGITCGFFLIVAAASWLPARRAASIDPTQALRSE
jgi:predicted permease